MTRGKKVLMSSHYKVKKDGKYYVVISFCDPKARNTLFSEQTTTLNRYGHLPAGIYGLLGFTRLLTFVYTVLFLVWVVKCCQYRRELMSIHVLISFVLFFLTLDALSHCLTLAAYNADGTSSSFGTALTVLLDALVNALLRCVVLVIAIGCALLPRLTHSLGVSRASLGSLFWRFLALAVLCFGVALWHGAFPHLFPQSTSLWGQLPSTCTDTLVYYLFLTCLSNTMEQLELRKQTSKLGVFRTLRIASYIAIAALILYSAAYGYLAAYDLLPTLWKIEWMLNEGADNVFCLFVVVMIMVGPDVRSEG